MEAEEDGPVLPPSLPPTLPPSDAPRLPPSRPAGGQTTDAADALLADQMATRNVPVAASRRVDLGLPDAPEATPEAAAADTEFVRPELVSMGDATTALLVGRVLLAVAALLVGIAARRATGVGGADHADAFWPVVWSAGVFALVGFAGLVFWSVRLADNARRLKARSATPKATAWSWILVPGFVAFSSLTYLQVDVGGDLDPMPGVAAVGWLVVLAIPYGRLQGVFNGLTRTPPKVWFTAFPIDLIAVGLLWWRLTSWPSPLVGESDHVGMTANIAFGASAALVLNVLVYGWLAQQGANGIFARLGRLEARHRGTDASQPEWFQTGLVARPAPAVPAASTSDPSTAPSMLAPGDPADPMPMVAPASGPQRPLIPTRHLGTTVAVLHALWGLALVGFSVVLAMIAFEYSDVTVLIGDELFIDDSDSDRLAVFATVVAVAYVAAIVAHAVWAVLVAINGRRVTVHSPNPGTFAIAFAPMPLLVGAGLVIGGTLGYWLVAAGLTIAFFALILVNQMLMALAARQGGSLSGFGRWSLCFMLVYFAGVGLNVLYAQGAPQVGLYATLSLVQGVLITIGARVGFTAMRGLEQTLRTKRQTTRHRDPGVSPSAPPPGTV